MVKRHITKTPKTHSKTLHSKHTHKTPMYTKLATIKKYIGRNNLRKYQIQRTRKILKIIPLFEKFYKKLSDHEIIALKFYKHIGSRWQTNLLTNTSKQREIQFPFEIYNDMELREDIIGENAANLIPVSKTNINDMNTYIKTSLTARITLLNRLENIFNRSDCPKLTGNEILFRGISIFPELKKKKVGDTIKFKNFMSSSIDKNVGEGYADNTLLVFLGLKNVPFLYMPNAKMYSEYGYKFATFIVDQSITDDLSEFVLPRNLEFKIDAIDDDYKSYTQYAHRTSFKKILKLLTKKGVLNSVKSLAKNTKLTDTVDKQGDEQGDEQVDANVSSTVKNNKNNKNNKNTNKSENIIKHALFSKMNVYFLSFIKMHKEEPITYNAITHNAKFILDKDALRTWQTN
uniref:Uncharacterized protein n=1 Tax=viral metagenome TaxID=1070528 RepID=A0A6C0HLX9_9ZZZZ